MFRPLRAGQLVFDCAVAAAFYLLIALPFSRGEAAWFPTLAGFALAVALAFRRLSPGLALGIAWAAAILQMAGGMPPNLADVAILAVLYTTAAYGSRLEYWLGFASAIVGAVVITVYLFLGPSILRDGLSWSTLSFAVVVLVASLFGLLLAWTVGALVRTGLRARENRRAQVRAEAETAAEQERVRIARDMHDVVAHSLAVVIAQADGARYAGASDAAAATAALETISSTARSALADVRLLLTQLRHPQGDGPQPTLADLEGLYAQVRAAGVDLRVEVDPAPRSEPPAAVQLAVYRILQEALTNALRHGDGGPVSVRLAWRADRVDVEVRNGMPPGTPGTAPGARVSAGHGVIGMRERAQLAGGRLDVVADAGEFAVRATLPTGAVDAG